MCHFDKRLFVMGMGVGEGGGVDKLASHHTTSSEKFRDFSGPHPSPDIFSKLNPSLLIEFLQSLVNWSFSKTEKKKTLIHGSV